MWCDSIWCLSEWMDILWLINQKKIKQTYIVIKWLDIEIKITKINQSIEYPPLGQHPIANLRIPAEKLPIQHPNIPLQRPRVLHHLNRTQLTLFNFILYPILWLLIFSYILLFYPILIKLSHISNEWLVIGTWLILLVALPLESPLNDEVNLRVVSVYCLSWL